MSKKPRGHYIVKIVTTNGTAVLERATRNQAIKLKEWFSEKGIGLVDVVVKDMRENAHEAL